MRADLASGSLDVRCMRVLAEVARQGSFRAAARSLSYTTSAVSQQVSALEREAGVALVERSANRIRLTAAGEVLVGHAETILAQLAAARSELDAIAGLEVGQLRLASFASAGMRIVPAAMRAFADRHPDVVLSYLEGDPEQTVPRLLDGALDLVLAYEYDLVPVELRSGLRRVALLEDPIHVVLPREHAAAAQDEDPRLEELVGEAWIVEPRDDCHHFTVRACEAAGLAPAISCHSSDYAVTQSLVAAGFGLALVPALALEHPNPEVVVRRLRGQSLTRVVFAVHRAQSERIPAVGAMLDALRGPAGSSRA